MSPFNASRGASPFFDVVHFPDEAHYGRITASLSDVESIGMLDFYGATSPHRGAVPADDMDRCSPVDRLETALLYIAACIAEDQGQDIVYCRSYAAGRQAAPGAWKALPVRPLLDRYEAVVHCQAR